MTLRDVTRQGAALRVREACHRAESMDNVRGVRLRLHLVLVPIDGFTRAVRRAGNKLRRRPLNDEAAPIK